MWNKKAHLDISVIDDFLSFLRKSCNTDNKIHFKNNRFEIISPHDYPSIYLIKNIATGTIFSPSKDLQHQINLVRELSNEI